MMTGNKQGYSSAKYVDAFHRDWADGLCQQTVNLSILDKYADMES